MMEKWERVPCHWKHKIDSYFLVWKITVWSWLKRRKEGVYFLQTVEFILFLDIQSEYYAFLLE